MGERGRERWHLIHDAIRIGRYRRIIRVLNRLARGPVSRVCSRVRQPCYQRPPDLCFYQTPLRSGEDLEGKGVPSAPERLSRTPIPRKYLGPRVMAGSAALLYARVPPKTAPRQAVLTCRGALRFRDLLRRPYPSRATVHSASMLRRTWATMASRRAGPMLGLLPRTAATSSSNPSRAAGSSQSRWAAKSLSCS